MRICLVVDGSSVIRKVARRILEDFDLTVVEAADSASALEISRRSMPDLLLVDWNLPLSGDDDLIAAVRRLPGGRAPKIVLLASETDAARIARARRSGADDYMLKPFDRASLEAKMHELGLL